MPEKKLLLLLPSPFVPDTKTRPRGCADMKGKNKNSVFRSQSVVVVRVTPREEGHDCQDFLFGDDKEVIIKD